jgi:23S rRNA pseudouridine1911/1915/1917 synthase
MVTEKHDITVTEDGEGQRLDAFLAQTIADLTRSAAQRLIDGGLVHLGGSVPKASVKLRAGDRLTVEIPPPEPTAAQPEEIPLEILYEDRDLVVVNKPAGMVVHPGAGNREGTLVNALLGHCGDLSGIGGEVRPGIVHRIDKDTSGVLVVAKNDGAHQKLAAQFSAHTVKRIYLALVFGAMKTDTGRVEGVIGRHPTDRTKMSGAARHGKHAVTHWRVVGRYPGICLLRLRLETGRTHQIRVHLSESGHPLVGDEVYGGSGRVANLKDPGLRSLVKELGRQALHAKTLGFIHPSSGDYLEFDTELPPDMQGILDYLERTSNHGDIA